MKTRLQYCLAVFAMSMVVCAAPLRAQDEAAPEPEAAAEAPKHADGTKLMGVVGGIYAKLKTWQGSIEVYRLQKTSGGSFSGKAIIKVALQTPNKLRVTVKATNLSATTKTPNGRTMSVIWNDGHLTIINEDTKKYMALPLPGLSYDMIATHERAVPFVLGSGQLLTRLVSSRPLISLTGGMPVEQLKPTKIGEVEVEHLRVKITEGYRHIYVSKADQSVVRIAHDPAEILKKMIEQDPANADAEFVFHVTMSDQVFNKELPADTFTFTPPKGYTKVRLAPEVFKAPKKVVKPFDPFGDDVSEPKKPKEPKKPGKKEA